MFGAFMDAAFMIPRMMHDEEMQNDMQSFNQGEAGVARSFNSAEAIAQREWSERMANTQHQRGVADMRAAGINPIMSVRQGSAGVGSASAASVGSASGGTSNTGGGATSFTGAQLNAAQTHVMEAQEKLLLEQKRAEHEHIYQRHSEAFLAEQRAKTEIHNTDRAKHEAEIASNAAKGSALEGEIDTTEYGNWMRIIDRAIKALTGAGSAYRNFGGNR